MSTPPPDDRPPPFPIGPDPIDPAKAGHGAPGSGRHQPVALPRPAPANAGQRPRRIPSLNWLRVFEAAARCGSFARAAEHLNMSPPAVSQQVRALESHLGATLFTRGPRSISLTDIGWAFLPAVQSSLWTMETTAEALFGDRRRTSLTVHVNMLLSIGWLSPRLARFRAAHPDIALTLITAVRDDDYLQQAADLRLVFGSGPLRVEDGDVLFGERLYPVAHPDLVASLATTRDDGTGTDLLDWPLVEVAGHRAGWLRWLQGHGFDTAGMRPFLVCDSTAVALSLAAGGGMVALARAPGSDLLERRFGLVPCLPGSAIDGHDQYRLLHDGPHTLSPVARRFRTWLLAEAAAAVGAADHPRPAGASETAAG